MTMSENIEIIENKLKYWGFTVKTMSMGQKQYRLGNLFIYLRFDTIELEHAVETWMVTFDLDAPPAYFIAMIQEAVRTQEGTL